MRIGSSSESRRTRVVVLTADSEFDRTTRAIFGVSSAIDLVIKHGSVAEQSDALNVDDVSVVIVDLDAGSDAEMAALGRLMARIGEWPPVVAAIQTFDESLARILLKMRVADFLMKPIKPLDLVRACARVAKSPAGSVQPAESQIYTFLPAVGGAGVTTLAVQTAMLLLNSSGRRAKPATCLVDLNFQHGAVADYLDLEPRLNLAEIEPRPDRLDRQLLEVMLSYHASGLAVVAAPNRPAEMRLFDPDVVTRLLDLVSTNFDYVVFDMPRTWFSWTDSVLFGSNKLFIVSETSVPSLRHAKQLVAAVQERLSAGPKPQVIVNRFEQRLFSAGLRRSDLEQALGDAFAGTIPNDYALVREAIDRGAPLDEIKPGNKITAQIKKLVVNGTMETTAVKSATPAKKKLSFSIAS
jgi:pilus assembly protein CpaE